MAAATRLCKTEGLHNLELYGIGDTRTVHVESVLGLVAERKPLALLDLLLIRPPLIGNHSPATHTADRNNHGRTFLLDVWGESIFQKEKAEGRRQKAEGRRQKAEAPVRID